MSKKSTIKGYVLMLFEKHRAEQTKLYKRRNTLMTSTVLLSIWDHSFSKYAEFSEKLTFLTP